MSSRTPKSRPQSPSEIRERFSPRAVARRLLRGSSEPTGWPAKPPVRTTYSKELDEAVKRAADELRKDLNR